MNFTYRLLSSIFAYSGWILWAGIFYCLFYIRKKQWLPYCHLMFTFTYILFYFMKRTENPKMSIFFYGKMCINKTFHFGNLIYLFIRFNTIKFKKFVISNQFTPKIASSLFFLQIFTSFCFTSPSKYHLQSARNVTRMKIIIENKNTNYEY